MKLKILTSKEREDKNVTKKNVFDRVRFEISEARTVILTFKSIEDAVVIKAVHSLDIYAEELESNLNTLYIIQVLEPLLPLFFHEDLYIRRFAAKLTALLTQIYEVRNELIDESDKISIFVHSLANEEDVAMQEYFLYILSWITTSPAGTDKILKTDFLTICLRLLKSTADPDVTLNIIHILSNVLQDPLGITAFRANALFNFEYFMRLLEDSFLEIKEGLLKLLELLTRYSDMQARFRAIGGLKDLLLILESEKVVETHLPILKIIQGYLHNHDHAEYIFHIGGLSKLVCYIQSCENQTLKENAIQANVALAQLEPLLNPLFIQKFDLFMISLLKSDDQLSEIACKGLVAMSRHSGALANMFSAGSVGDLVNMIKDANKPVRVRQAASLALVVLSRRGLELLSTTLEEKILDDVFNVISSPITDEIAITLISCLRVWSMNVDLRNRMIKKSLISVFLSCIKDGSTAIKTEACITLCGFLCETSFRKLFLESSAPMEIADCLKAEKFPLKHAALMVVQIAAADKTVGLTLAKYNAISEILQQQDRERVPPSWSTTLETLLRSNVSVKFSFTGRLDLSDETNTGFYVAPFSYRQIDYDMLDNILSSRVSPIPRIYVTNFDITPEPVETTDKPIDTKGSKTSSPPKSANSKSKQTRGKDKPATEVQTIPLEALNKYGILSNDTYLISYVQQLKERIHGIASIVEQGQCIANFVCDKMSGPSPQIDCTNETIQERHFTEIKNDIERNIIPLGLIRIGGCEHRAVLYKVLADRIGFPCSLVRGRNDRMWIEVQTVGEYIKEDGAEKETRRKYIIDLIGKIGRFIPVNSPEAKVYKGL